MSVVEVNEDGVTVGWIGWSDPIALKICEHPCDEDGLDTCDCGERNKGHTVVMMFAWNVWIAVSLAASAQQAASLLRSMRDEAEDVNLFAKVAAFLGEKR